MNYRIFLCDAHLTPVFDEKKMFNSHKAALANARRMAKAFLSERGCGHYTIGRWADDLGRRRAIVRNPDKSTWHHADDDIVYTLWVTVD